MAAASSAAHQALGHPDRAAQHRQEALDRFARLGVPEPDEARIPVSRAGGR